jgi:hypothetical protein
MLTIHSDDPIAIEVTKAIQAGDLASLQRLLGEHPGLSSARIDDHKGGSRILLHVATDWPGHFPDVAAVIAALIEAGADPNDPDMGIRWSETPLHWAASSDDVEALDALIDGGANIEVTGASIAGGTPLDDAVGYGQWQVARQLVERGARTKLWHAAALGMMSRVEEYFAQDVRPSPYEITEAFWQACHGGQRQTAQYLLNQGADLNWIPSWAEKTPLDIVCQGANELSEWLHSLGAKSAKDLV